MSSKETYTGINMPLLHVEELKSQPEPEPKPKKRYLQITKSFSRFDLSYDFVGEFVGRNTLLDMQSVTITRNEEDADVYPGYTAVILLSLSDKHNMEWVEK